MNAIGVHLLNPASGERLEGLRRDLDSGPLVDGLKLVPGGKELPGLPGEGLEEGMREQMSVGVDDDAVGFVTHGSRFPLARVAAGNPPLRVCLRVGDGGEHLLRVVSRMVDCLLS